MSELHFDEYEKYNFEHDKHMFSGHSGKQRTKKEASEHTNHHDPSGHSRKIVTKLKNTEENKKQEQKPKEKAKN
jgi:hypothetical protein